jgi:galactokinase
MTPLEILKQEFQREYGVPPRWIARAPGRVNLIGEHTDYNDGLVLPMAIERDVMIAAAPGEQPQIRLRSTSAGDAATIDLSLPVAVEPNRHWSNYPRGVLAGFLERGLQPMGFDLLVHSTVPVGVGLSSSAALEVAMATLLEAITARDLDRLEKVFLCQGAEHRYAGVSCGIMDQFVSTFAQKDRLVLLDCRSFKAQQVPFEDPALSILIVSTNVRRELSHSEYALRRAQCEQAVHELSIQSLRDLTPDGLRLGQRKLNSISLKRARHVVMEIARTQEAAHALRERHWSQVGALMYKSHQSLRTDFEVSCPELDTLVEIAQSIGEDGGVFGCRMTGGGFGGCAVALIRTDAAEAIAGRIRTQYAQHFSTAPTLFVSRPAAGARILQ